MHEVKALKRDIAQEKVGGAPKGHDSLAKERGLNLENNKKPLDPLRKKIAQFNLQFGNIISYQCGTGSYNDLELEIRRL